MKNIKTCEEATRGMTKMTKSAVKNLIEQYNYLLDKKAEFEHSLNILKNYSLAEPVLILETELDRVEQELDKLLKTEVTIRD